MSASKRVAATVAATDREARPRIEIVGERRRGHDAGFRAQVVSEAIEPGARIQEVARRHGVYPSLIYRWRRLAQSETPGDSAVRLFPVRIAVPQAPAPAVADPPPPRMAPKTRRRSVIEIELTSGVWVSVAMNAAMTAELVTDTLMMAIWRQGKPDALLHHSYRGSQYM